MPFCRFDPEPAEKMAILIAVATSYRAINVLADAKPGQTILIVGAGALVHSSD
jgi:D-arabinose 1-dehydrogenase-like Zn-dependent alcohol dehydrogenase